MTSGDQSPSPASDPFQSPVSVAPSMRRRSPLWWIAGGVIVVTCCCSGLCVVPLGTGVYQAVMERDDVELVVQSALRDVEAGNSDAAMKRFSSRTIRVGNVTREQIEQLATNVAFRDQPRPTVTNIHVSQSFNTNQDLPQGTVANVSGTVTYQGGGGGTFRATLEKEQGAWKLHSLHVQRATP